MTTIEQKIEEFESVFDHPANCEEAQKRGEGCACGIVEMVTFLRQALEQIRKETIEECEKAVPKEEKLPKSKCMNLENHMFGSCFACEKIKGFNACRSETLANLNNLK